MSNDPMCVLSYLPTVPRTLHDNKRKSHSRHTIIQWATGFDVGAGDASRASVRGANLQTMGEVGGCGEH